MKKLIFISFISFSIFSCEEKSAIETKTSELQKDAILQKDDFIKVDPTMSSPELFLGSGFGPGFMSFIRARNFEMALKFTSKESIDKHGHDVILEKYKNMKIDYILTRASKEEVGDKVILRYKTNEYATSKFKDFTVAIENDSCKIVLPDNLEDFLK